jgi:hypothetical protein
LNPTQRALHEADDQLATARRAIGACQVAIRVRPGEAEAQAERAALALAAARQRLLALFDMRVNADPLYNESRSVRG